jgi:Tol biopolymer transport system component
VGFIARTGEELNVWIMNADGSGVKQLTSDPPVVEELRADPLGRYFVFVGEQGLRTHLFRIDTDGGNLRQLTFGEGQEGDSAIAPDGTWIVYGSVALKDGPIRTELWKISIDGGQPIRFSEEPCASPAFSPDGSMVSCVRGDTEALILSAVDGKIIESYKLPLNSTVNFGVGWALDGSGLTFICGEKNVSNVCVLRRGHGTTSKLTNFTSGHITRYAFASDGSRLFVGRGYPVADAILISNFR